MPVLVVLALSIVLALVCTAIPWLARPLGGRPLAVGLGVGVAVGLIALVSALPPYPWADLVVLLVAWSGGLLLGRDMSRRFRPFLLWFLCFSVIDVLQALGGYPIAPRTQTAVDSSAVSYAAFTLLLPSGRFAISVVDILLLTTLAEHWRRRGGGYLFALLPGVLGFALADGFVLVTRLGTVPAIPFFTAGYLCTEGLYRYLSRHRAPQLTGEH